MILKGLLQHLHSILLSLTFFLRVNLETLVSGLVYAFRATGSAFQIGLGNTEGLSSGSTDPTFSNLVPFLQ